MFTQWLDAGLAICQIVGDYETQDCPFVIDYEMQDWPFVKQWVIEMQDWLFVKTLRDYGMQN